MSLPLTEEQIRSDERRKIMDTIQGILNTYPLRSNDRYLEGRRDGMESILSIINRA